MKVYKQILEKLKRAELSIFAYAFITVLLIGVFFRLAGLGYSNFQGDEAKVMDIGTLSSYKDIKWTLTQQLKGPGQYLLVYLTNWLSIVFASSNIIKSAILAVRSMEFFFRLPFAIASVIGLVFYAIFVLKTQTKIASFASLFIISFSGLILGLSRIVQYQSFILMFTSIILLLFYFLIQKESKNIAVIIGFVAATGLLFHYDILAVFLPLLLFLLINKKYKLLFYTFIPFFGFTFAAINYFYRNVNINFVVNYVLFNRIVGNNAYDAIYYSFKILSLYHPVEFLIMIFSGIFLFFYGLSKNVPINKFNIKIYNRISFVTIVWFVFGGIFIFRIFNMNQNSFLNVISLFLIIIFTINLFPYIKRFNILSFIVLYFFASFGFYFLVMAKPLTHIYAAFIPISFLAGQSMAVLNKKVFFVLFFILTISVITFNILAFIKVDKEYPWESKNYAFGLMSRTVDYNNKIDGIFGFPYNRNWTEISTKVQLFANFYSVDKYDSNEKDKITEFYLNKNSKAVGENKKIRLQKVDRSNPDTTGLIFIHVANPQSLDNKDFNPLNKDAKVLDKQINYSIYLIK